MEQKKNSKHHGKFIKDLIERSEKSQSHIADLSGFSRSSIYRWTDEEKLDLEKIHKIAVACGIDIEGELPELDYHRKLHHKSKDNSEKKTTPGGVSQEKYVELLEQLNEARQQVNDLQAKYYTTKERLDKLEKSKDQED